MKKDHAVNSDQNRSVVDHRTTLYHHQHQYLQKINHFQVINHHLQQLHYDREGIVTDNSGNIWTKPDDINDLNWFIIKLNNNLGLSQPQISKILEAKTPSIKLGPVGVSRRLKKIKKRYPNLIRANYKFAHRSEDSKYVAPEELGDLLKQVTEDLTGLNDNLGLGGNNDEDSRSIVLSNDSIRVIQQSTRCE